jgi:hypothetical protein
MFNGAYGRTQWGAHLSHNRVDATDEMLTLLIYISQKSRLDTLLLN